MMRRYKTIRSEPLSINQYLPAHNPIEEIVSEDVLKARYRMVSVEVGKTYNGYAGMGVYICNTIVEELASEQCSDKGKQ